MAAAGDAVVVGGFCELGDDGSLYNTAVVIDGGAVAGYYRKTHLWDREKPLHTGERMPPVLATRHGAIAVMVCYDLEFPEVTRAVAVQGAELIAALVNWPRTQRPPGERVGEVITAMSAARTNRVAIAVCDRTGEERGQPWAEGTAIIGADGWVTADVGPGTGMPSPRWIWPTATTSASGTTSTSWATGVWICTEQNRYQAAPGRRCCGSWFALLSSQKADVVSGRVGSPPEPGRLRGKIFTCAKPSTTRRFRWSSPTTIRFSGRTRARTNRQWSGRGRRRSRGRPVRPRRDQGASTPGGVAGPSDAGMDGGQVAAAVLRDELPTRVLLVSANNDSAIVYHALQKAGAAGYLPKSRRVRRSSTPSSSAPRAATSSTRSWRPGWPPRSAAVPNPAGPR